MPIGAIIIYRLPCMHIIAYSSQMIPRSDFKKNGQIFSDMGLPTNFNYSPTSSVIMQRMNKTDVMKKMINLT